MPTIKIAPSLLSADFADIARKNSQEPTSAANGGDVGWLREPDMMPQVREQLSGGAQFAPPRLDQPLTHAAQRAEQRLAIGHHQFGSAGGCRRTHVGDEIGDGEINFVADR